MTNVIDVGLLTMVPYLLAALAMVMLGRCSDRAKERRWHVAVPAILGAAGLVASTFVPHQPLIAHRRRSMWPVVRQGLSLFDVPLRWCDEADAASPMRSDIVPPPVCSRAAILLHHSRWRSVH